MRGNLGMRGYTQHYRVDASFIWVALEHDGLYPTHTRTSGARIALLRELELARGNPLFAHILFLRCADWTRWRRRVEILSNEADCVLWTLFHQPVPRVRYDCLLYVDCQVPHDHRFQRSERLFPSDRQYWHGQFHLLENFVVCCIGGERRELREASPHASGLRVGGGEEISRGFVGF